MACDLIVASETAQFGQPETGVGVIPGAGGTQRLTRAVGKSLAMDVVLSGRFLSADEALRAGLVARVVARKAWLDEAKRVARPIAEKPPVATRLAKEAVDRVLREHARTGRGVRTAPARPRVRLRGCEGGAERVPREAQAGVQREVRRRRRGRKRWRWPGSRGTTAPYDCAWHVPGTGTRLAATGGRRFRANYTRVVAWAHRRSVPLVAESEKHFPRVRRPWRRTS